MNRIIAEEDKIVLDNINTDIQINSSKIDIFIKGNVIINEINQTNNNLNINFILNNAANLTYNRFDQVSNLQIEYNIEQQENSIFNLNQSIYAFDEVSCTINANIQSNCQNNLIVRGVTEDKGAITIKADGIVSENTKDSIIEEDIRILTLNDESSTTIPNLLVSTNETIANHKVTMGCIDSNYLFYLKSKGLSELKAIKLIKDGFLINHLDNKMITKIKEILKD